MEQITQTRDEQGHLLPALREQMRVEAWDLHLEGNSYRDITKQLNETHGTDISHVNVYLWLKNDARQLAKDRPNMVDEYREMMGAQYDRVIKSSMKNLENEGKTNTHTGHLALEALKNKAKLFGLNMPERKEIKTELTLPQLLARGGDITEEEIQEASFTPLPEVDIHNLTKTELK